MSYHPKPKIRLDNNQPTTLSEKIIEENVDLYVQNIPNDLTKEGIENIFMVAGQIDSIRMFPNKNSDTLTKFAFIHYKTKAAAMKAIQMFNKYKFGSSMLTVKFSKPLSNNNNNNNNNDSNGNNRKTSRSDDFNDSDRENRNGRREKTSDSYDRDDSRYLSNRTLDSQHASSRKDSVASVNSSQTGSPKKLNISGGSRLLDKKFSNLSKKVAQPDLTKRDRFKIDTKYEIQITCALNPSLFYIQTKETLEQVGNLMNNMHNCYRNEDESSSGVKDLKIGSYCASYDDQCWYRSQIIGIKDANKYTVRVIDFGDVYEVDIEKIRSLKPEFCVLNCAAVKCCLAGVKPYKSTKWSEEALLIMHQLTMKEHDAEQQGELFIKPVDYLFDDDNNETCVTHLYLNNESESIADYLIDKESAEPVTIHKTTTNSSSIITTSTTATSITTVTAINNHLEQNVYSVSQENLNRTGTCDVSMYLEPSIVEELNAIKSTSYAPSTCTISNTMINSIQRTKLFNCTFQIWKWKDLKTIHAYRCSPQLIKIKITRVYSTNKFYIQKENDLKSISLLNECIQNYANVLLSDEMMYTELYNYMLYTSKNDVVIAKSPIDHQWKRAVVLDKPSIDEFYGTSRDNLQHDQYFSVLFIDYGYEQLIRYTRNLESFEQHPVSMIVVLPLNEKLVQLEPYALKCSLSRTDMKKYLYHLTTDCDPNSSENETKFEIKFRDILQNKTSNNNDTFDLFMKIVQCENFRGEIEAVVELYKIDANNNKTNIINYVKSEMNEASSVKKGGISEPKTTTEESTDSDDAYQQRHKPHLYELTPKISGESIKTKSKPIKSDVMKYVNLLQAGETYDSTVIYLSNNKKLFIMDNINSDSMIKIQDFVNNGEFLSKKTQTASEVNNGDLVIALYEVEGSASYYRAIVIDKKLVENKIKLFFVDYGNEELISIDSIRCVISTELTDDDLNWVYHAFNINYCELNFLNDDLNDESILTALKENLEYKQVIIRVLHVYVPISTPTPTIDNYMPKYLINLFMDKKDEANNEQRLFKLLMSIQQQQEIKAKKQASEQKLQQSKVKAEISLVSINSSQQFADADTYIDEKKSPIVPSTTITTAATTKQLPEFIKLNKNNIYSMTFQYSDTKTNIIYLNLSDNIDKLNILSELLQHDHKNSHDIEYIHDINQIKPLIEQYEALFSDNKWYRCVVCDIDKQLNQLNIYYVDYGNNEVVSIKDLEVKKCLRRRKIKSNRNTTGAGDAGGNENIIFNLEYQAIKCIYDKSVDEFYDDLTKYINEENQTFKINCLDVFDDKQEISVNRTNVYLFELVNETTQTTVVTKKFDEIVDEDDKEVLDILQKSLNGSDININFESEIISLECNQDYPITVTHIVNTSEFYVQLNENFNLLLEHQQKIQLLMEQLLGLKQSQVARKQEFKIGDYVFAKYSYDFAWYRGVIMSEKQEISGINKYDVFFVDYGNKELAALDSIYAIKDVYKALGSSTNATKVLTYENVDKISNLKFQAIMCKLDRVKNVKRNTEILKIMINDCLNLHMKCINIDKCTFGGYNEQVEQSLSMINHYSIDFYSDNELLNDKFEQIEEKHAAVEVVQEEEKPKIEEKSKKQENDKRQNNLNDQFKLNKKQIYRVKLACAENPHQFYVHLTDHEAYLSEIETYLNSNQFNTINKSNKTFKINDLILSKYYLEDGTHKWYRAKIVDIDYQLETRINKIFYIDYGNFEENVEISNVVSLDVNHVYNRQLLDSTPPLAYCIKLNMIKIDIERHLQILNDFFQLEAFLVRVVDVEETSDKNVYVVEAYNLTEDICYNSLFDADYKLVAGFDDSISFSEENDYMIKYSNYQEITPNVSAYVKCQYVQINELSSPIYFYLDSDAKKVNLFMNEFNAYYNQHGDELSIKSENDLLIGGYYAIKLIDNFWYRVKLVSLDQKTHLAKCFLVDHGAYENDVCYFDISTRKYSFKTLTKSYLKCYRFAFKVYLVDVKEYNERKTIKKLEYNDEQLCSEIFASFFFDSDNKIKPLKMKICSFDLQKDDDYTFYVEIFSAENESLNEKIRISQMPKIEQEEPKKAVVVQPVSTPSTAASTPVSTHVLPAIQTRKTFLKVNLKEIPKQNFDTKQIYHLFVQSIDLFYLFDENAVKVIQEHVQDVCLSILESNVKFDFNLKTNQIKSMPEIGNLIFVNYNDDDNWYRCVITNIKTETYTKYEVFFIDFGSVEIVDIENILLPFEEKHLICFYKYAPQAFKSKLYGYMPSSHGISVDNCYKEFKSFVANKQFDVKVIKKTIDNDNSIIHHVKLNEYKTNVDVHSYLIEKNFADFEQFSVILRNIKTNEEFDFYQDCLKIMKAKLGL